MRQPSLFILFSTPVLCSAFRVTIELHAGALELCLVSDLEEIGLPRFAAEQIAVHFGKILPGAAVLDRERAAVLEEPMPEDPSELDLSEARPDEPDEPDEPEPEPELEPELESDTETETEIAVLDAFLGEPKLPLSAAGKEDVNVFMEDPVFTASGQTYERDSISLWLRTKQTDPISNARLPNKKLVPNFALRGAIEQWKEAHPDYFLAEFLESSANKNSSVS